MTDATRLDRRYVLTEWLNSADDKTHEARRIIRSVAGEARFGRTHASSQPWNVCCVAITMTKDTSDNCSEDVIWLLHRLARNGDPEYIVSLSRTRLYVQVAGFVMRLCSTQLGGG